MQPKQVILKQTFEKCVNALMMLLCMNDECHECHMHADDTWQDNKAGHLGKGPHQSSNKYSVRSA